MYVNAENARRTGIIVARTGIIRCFIRFVSGGSVKRMVLNGGVRLGSERAGGDASHNSSMPRGEALSERPQ